jgi:KUP system potassium uptake protein
MKQDSRAPLGRSLKRDLSLTLGALGVVFGDIGTSPLYAMRESALAVGGHAASQAAVYGALSLIFWALVVVVTLKYVGFIMRADNNGEGGVMALAALAHRAPVSRGAKTAIGVAALMGLALFYGDGMLTPAISVLSAMEGLGASDTFKTWIVPLTLVILVGLFLMQSRGTDKIGKVFGPIMVVWFIVLAVLGALEIIKQPRILFAADPRYAFALFASEPWTAFVALGSVVLAVTGCEALYADMGHFGARAIRWAWLYVAFPALVLNYFGQGALLLSNPGAAPFLF